MDSKSSASLIKPYPIERSGHGMIHIPDENVLLVFGGRRNKNADGDLNDLWEYDIERNEWNEPNSNQDQEKGPHELMTMTKVLQLNRITNAFKVKNPPQEHVSPDPENSNDKD